VKEKGLSRLNKLIEMIELIGLIELIKLIKLIRHFNPSALPSLPASKLYAVRFFLSPLSFLLYPYQLNQPINKSI